VSVSMRHSESEWEKRDVGAIYPIIVLKYKCCIRQSALSQIRMQCNCQSGSVAEASENKQLVFRVVNEFIGLLVQSLGKCTCALCNYPLLQETSPLSAV
jgi:hypothetical protein